jgi:phosphoribosylformylglycinamidine (FGAM) synthase-like amidotransferase family enzyme
VNKEYIATHLCENKNKPMLHCNGKCHLQKQLAAAEKKEKSPFSQNTKDKFELQYFSENTVSVKTLFAEETKANSVYSFSIPNTSLKSIFHPPPVLI